MRAQDLRERGSALNPEIMEFGLGLACGASDGASSLGGVYVRSKNGVRRVCSVCVWVCLGVLGVCLAVLGCICKPLFSCWKKAPNIAKKRH